MTRIRIVALAGSTRQDSYNRKLLDLTAVAMRHAGAEVTCWDIREHALPLYDSDLPMPTEAIGLQKLILEHDGLVIASPECNASVTAALKNVLDWIARVGPPGCRVPVLEGKQTALMSAVEGQGGNKGLQHLRDILRSLGAVLLPEQLIVQRVSKVIGSDGRTSDTPVLQQIESLARNLVSSLALRPAA